MATYDDKQNIRRIITIGKNEESREYRIPTKLVYTTNRTTDDTKY